MSIVALAASAQGFAKSPDAMPEPETKFSAERNYDLGALIDLGLATNPGTRAAWHQARAAAAAVGAAKAPYYPQLSARFEGGSDQWYTPAANGPDNFRREQATTILSLEYLLLDFGRRAADVRQAVARFDASGLLYERRLQQVVFQIQRTYFAHEAALRRQQAAAAMRDVSKIVAETVALQAGTGLSAKPEVLEAQKKVLEAEYELESADALVHTSLGDLCVAVGLPANTRLSVSKSDAPASSAGLREKAGKLIEQALSSRPDLAARAADVRAAEAATKRAGAEFFPEVKLEGKYAYSAFQYDAQDGRTKGSYSEDLNGYGGFLVAKWDLFDGFERTQNLRKRKEQETAAREDLSQARLDASRDVWTAYHDHLSATRRVDYAEGLAASARENFEATRAAYRSGLSPISEFSDSAARLSLAESVRADALADYSTSLAALAFATGLPAAGGQRAESGGR